MKKNDIPFQIFLKDEDRPKKWYNIRSEFPDIEPYLNEKNEVVSKEDLYAIFPESLAEQELSMEKYIDIPEEVDSLYRSYRSTPLHRAYALEKALGTPARLYYKYEGNNPSGSHKLNTAIPQVYFNKISGTKKLTTETGAGQWGTALAMACAAYDIECEIFMVKSSAHQKMGRRKLMETFGATVHESPSKVTNFGRSILEKDKNNGGSLGIAISEAIEVAVTGKNTKYALGSVLNHVSLHQTIIGLEAIKQFEMIDEKPDTVIACCGGGSNFAGMAFPFVEKIINGKSEIDIIGVEPAACPSLTKGKYAYDFGDTAHFTPKMLQYTLGNGFMPPSIHAGGLRYHGMGPLVSKVVHEKYARAVSIKQSEVFNASKLFNKTELILPAPESSHAIAQAIKEALICKETGEEKVILFNVSGHGLFDTSAFIEFREGKIVDCDEKQEYLDQGFSTIPK